MIISFAWTTPALLAGAKTVTRRSWAPSHAERFKPGMVVDAYDSSPRVRGRKVAEIRITRTPWLQRTSELAAAEDWDREGIAWLHEHGYRPGGGGSWAVWWDAWRAADELVYVVEFELVKP